MGPVVVNETAKFVGNFPETFETTFGGWEGVNNIGKTIGIDDLRGEIDKSISGISDNLLGLLGNNLVSSVSGIADVVMKVVLVLILTLLFLLEGPAILNAMWKKQICRGIKAHRTTYGRRGFYLRITPNASSNSRRLCNDGHCLYFVFDSWVLTKLGCANGYDYDDFLYDPNVRAIYRRNFSHIAIILL